MTIEICAVGGYKEVGKNMTAVKVDDEVIILDMGIHLENYINYTEDEDVRTLSNEELLSVQAIPNDNIIKNWKHMVKAIVPSHAHLDHLGAIPFLAKTYENPPIIATPFSSAVLRAIMRDNKMRISNEIIELNPNSKIKISDNITIELINVTHSTPQTSIICIHTHYGKILYACDFKFDDSPGIGKKTNYRRLEELSKEGVLALFCDSTYAEDKRKMPSEEVARAALKEVLQTCQNENNLIIVTTFSSHLSRIKAIIENGQKINRKIVLLGRSLSKYIEAGIETGIFNIPDDVEMVKFSSKIKKHLKRIKNRQNYLLIVTGHQGERKATLSKMATGELEFNIKPGDHIVFSCTVIPTETNRENRKELERELEGKKARIFRDIHVSGHGAREDLRDLIDIVKPKHIVPAHGFDTMKSALKKLALEMGYKEKRIHMLHDGDFLKIQ